MADPVLNSAERVEWNIGMNTILYFSPSGVVYETRAYSKADIAELVNDYGLESLTSTDRQFDFWFTSSARRCQQRPNRRATGLLLATTRFTAKTVPLLHGAVVVATHDSDGDLDGLSWQQLDLLVQMSRSLTGHDDRVLSRRITRGARRQRRNVEAAQAATAHRNRPRTRGQLAGLKRFGSDAIAAVLVKAGNRSESSSAPSRITLRPVGRGPDHNQSA